MTSCELNQSLSPWEEGRGGRRGGGRGGGRGGEGEGEGEGRGEGKEGEGGRWMLSKTHGLKPFQPVCMARMHDA